MNSNHVRPGRVRAAVVAALIAASTVAVLASPAQAAAPPTATRIAGANRWETASLVAQAAYPSGAGTVVLAYGRDYADALAASALAGKNNAPILLTLTDELPAATSSALNALKPTKIIVVGGKAVVSDALVNSLSAKYTVTRVAGSTRWETASAVASQVGASSTVFLAYGRNYADALAVSPGAHSANIPVLLTDTDTLHPQAASAITATGATTVVIAGGASVVSDSIATGLQNQGKRVIRLAGGNRYATARAVAEWLVSDLGFETDTVFLATGEDFADALAGGPLASVVNGPMLLTPTNSLHSDAAAFLSAHDPSTITLFGGTSALSAAVSSAAVNAAATASTQSLGITPTAPAVVPVVSESSTLDDRTYTVTGLNNAKTYDVFLVDGSAIADERLDDADKNLVADTAGTAAAAITKVKGGNVAATDLAANVVPASGSFNFTVDGTAPGTAVPVVIEDDADDLLEVNANGTPTSPFAVGGALTVEPPAATTAANGPDGRVVFRDVGASSGVFWLDTAGAGAGNFDVTTADVAVRFDFNDTLKVGGTTVTAAVFVSKLTRGDHVSIAAYSAIPSQVSVIDLDADSPGTPTVTALATGDDVTVTIAGVGVTDESLYDSFVIQRAPDSGGSPGTWTTVATITSADDADTGTADLQYVNTNVAAGTYWYRAWATLDGQQTSTGQIVASVVTIIDNTAPKVLANGAVQDVDGGSNDVLDAGDVFKLYLDEPVVLATPTLQVSDGAQSGTLTHGGNATFSVNGAASGPFAPGEIVTVTVNSTVTNVGAASYTITNRSGITDSSANALDYSADSGLEDNGPEMVAAVVTSATSIVVHFNETLNAGTVVHGDFAYDADGVGGGGAVTPDAAAVQAGNLQVTLTVAGGAVGGTSQVAIVAAIDDAEGGSTLVQAKLTTI